ncbi:MAG: DUF5752 family protein [Dissulfurispiraceae bacterium]
MEDTFEPSEFTQSLSILKSIGKKARNLHELMTLIRGMSQDPLFYHTYQYFTKGHILEYTNEFTYWAVENLGERILAEHLSNIDPSDFKDIADLRKKLRIHPARKGKNGNCHHWPRLWKQCVMGGGQMGPVN